jgi:hypothetical protein
MVENQPPELDQDQPQMDNAKTKQAMSKIVCGPLFQFLPFFTVGI